MRDESEVWQALLKRKGLSVTDLAGQLGVTRQHAHRLLTGRRPAESQRDELEQALALGTPISGNPLYGIGELDDNGETEIPVAAIVEEIRTGLDATLRGRAQARDPAYLSEVELRLQRLN